MQAFWGSRPSGLHSLGPMGAWSPWVSGGPKKSRTHGVHDDHDDQDHHDLGDDRDDHDDHDVHDYHDDQMYRDNKFSSLKS